MKALLASNAEAAGELVYTRTGRMRRARFAWKVPPAKAEPPAALWQAQGVELALFDETCEVGRGVAGQCRRFGEAEDTILVRRPDTGQVFQERAAERGPAYLCADLVVLRRPGLPLGDELGFRHGSLSPDCAAPAGSAIIAPFLRWLSCTSCRTRAQFSRTTAASRSATAAC